MDQEVLNNLLSRITLKRYVNLFFIDCEENNESFLQTLLPVIKQSQDKNLCIDVDIRVFVDCETEAKEANILLQIINNNPSTLQNEISIPGAISITDTMDRLNIALTKPGLIIFYCFEDNYSEKEKDILRSIRKFINMIMREGNIPRYLGILIVSSDRIDNWELFPDSNLDSRHVSFVAYQAG